MRRNACPADRPKGVAQPRGQQLGACESRDSGSVPGRLVLDANRRPEKAIKLCSFIAAAAFPFVHDPDSIAHTVAAGRGENPEIRLASRTVDPFRRRWPLPGTFRPVTKRQYQTVVRIASAVEAGPNDRRNDRLTVWWCIRAAGIIGSPGHPGLPQSTVALVVSQSLGSPGMPETA